MNKDSKKDSILFEYYSRPFLLFHMEITNKNLLSKKESRFRKNFWQLVPVKTYEYNKAIEIIDSYVGLLNYYAKETISKHSVIYWLHIYRRLSLGPIGNDKRPQSIALTRAALEALIQKYGQLHKCNGIENSNDIDVSKIFRGLLLSEDFRLEREKLIQGKGETVLTNFGTQELLEFYEIEKIAYEIWRAGAIKRILAKGTTLSVIEREPYFIDNRNEELNHCVEVYDKRIRNGFATSSGVWWGKDIGSNQGTIFTPVYNWEKIKFGNYNQLITKRYNAKLDEDCVLNFLWYPYNIKDFYNAHKPYANEFLKKNGVSLESVLVVVISICVFSFDLAMNAGIDKFIHTWKRGYLYIYKNEVISQQVLNYKEYAEKMLIVEKIHPQDIEKAIKFWTLDSKRQENIDSLYSGPHQVFLPYSKDESLIDLAWIGRRLYDLFYNVNIKDQNFKGDALEIAVGRQNSILPKKSCESFNGGKRQIDFATEKEDILIIVECKAVAKSIAYDRGIKRAIDYRTENVVNRALTEIDDKALFLYNNVTGKNYSIIKYKYILPLAVSPFVEYMPSLESKYWIDREHPRVLTPLELKSFLNTMGNIGHMNNIIKLRN